jgi:hypothetical protein
MGLRERLSGRKPSNREADKPTSSFDIHRSGWTAQALHSVITGEQHEIPIERSAGTSQRLIEAIDDTLKWSGENVIEDRDTRAQLAASRSAELLRLAQLPELPPDGDDPAA